MDTIRDELKKCWDKIELESLYDESGNVKREPIKMLTIVPSHFLTGFATLLVYLSNELAKQDKPVVSMGEKQIYGGGKATPDPSVGDIMRILCGTDFERSTELHFMIQKFLDWFLGQEAIFDFDKEEIWYSFDNISKKWNEFIYEGGLEK